MFSSSSTVTLFLAQVTSSSTSAAGQKREVGVGALGTPVLLIPALNVSNAGWGSPWVDIMSMVGPTDPSLAGIFPPLAWKVSELDLHMLLNTFLFYSYFTDIRPYPYSSLSSLFYSFVFFNI